MKKRSDNNILWAIVSIIFWILVWTLAAVLIKNKLLMPSPLDTVIRLASLLKSWNFWSVSLYSLLRIVLGTVTGIIAGIVLAVLSALFLPADKILTPFISVIRSTPVASFIILVMLWIKSFLPSFISFLMVVPIVYSNTLTGMKSIDYSYLRMSRQFGLSPWISIKRIYVPSLIPFLKPAISNALGLSWKAGIAAEVLSFFPKSIGRQLSQAKNELETTDLFAWTLTVIILSVILEYAVKHLLEDKNSKNSNNGEEYDNTK